MQYGNQDEVHRREGRRLIKQARTLLQEACDECSFDAPREEECMECDTNNWMVRAKAWLKEGE